MLLKQASSRYVLGTLARFKCHTEFRNLITYFGIRGIFPSQTSPKKCSFPIDELTTM